jgi:hypothetical protein
VLGLEIFNGKYDGLMILIFVMEMTYCLTFHYLYKDKLTNINDDDDKLSLSGGRKIHSFI